MRPDFREREREVVPRWHSSASTVGRGEASSLPEPDSPVPQDERRLERKLADWRENRSVPFAADLLATAIVHSQPTIASEAAEFVLGEKESGSSLRRIADRCLSGEEVGQKAEEVPEDMAAPRRRIRALRSRLRRNPRNPLAWTDLSRQYAILGQLPQALHSMNLALLLAPDDRFVLRSAARLLAHSGRPDEAHRLLTRSQASNHDPWLMAAEIAVASVAEQRATLVGKGKRVLKAASVSPWHTSELASAIATRELEAGNDKRAKRHFRASLEEPSENSVAQAEWATTRLAGFTLLPGELETPNSFEARARDCAGRAEWKEALAHAWEWHLDEPFASEAITFGTYVASVCLEDYDSCIEFAERGLVANPRDVLIRNNLIFALASRGDVQRAETELTELPRPEVLEREHSAVVLATSGLVQYRRKLVEEGRALYREALSVARVMKEQNVEALAAIYFAREELLAGTAEAGEVVSEALRIGASTDLPEVKAWHETLRGELTKR